MLVVALAGLGAGAWVLMKRSEEYTRLADMHEARMKLNQTRVRNYRVRWVRAVNETEGLTENERHRAIAVYDANNKRNIDQGVARVAAYRRATRYPWLGPPRIPPQSDANQ
jgi:hypothetical protein